MARPFRDPGIPDGELTVYRGTIAGRAAGSATSTIARDGDRAYRHRLEIDFLDEASMVVEEGSFRGVRGVQFGGTLEPFPVDLTPLLGCTVALRGLDFTRGSRRRVSLWLAFHVHWPVEVRVERRERVEVPAGSFDTWRVRARPSFAAVAGPLDLLVGKVLPPFVLHFDAAAPHRLLRFAFPTGPFPWNPRALVEATDLS